MNVKQYPPPSAVDSMTDSQVQAWLRRIEWHAIKKRLKRGSSKHGFFKTSLENQRDTLKEVFDPGIQF